jgi:hypothetical protein
MRLEQGTAGISLLAKPLVSAKVAAGPGVRSIRLRAPSESCEQSMEAIMSASGRLLFAIVAVLPLALLPAQAGQLNPTDAQKADRAGRIDKVDRIDRVDPGAKPSGTHEMYQWYKDEVTKGNPKDNRGSLNLSGIAVKNGASPGDAAGTPKISRRSRDYK